MPQGWSPYTPKRALEYSALSPLAVRFNGRQSLRFLSGLFFFTQIVNLALIVTHPNPSMRIYLFEVVSGPLAVKHIFLDREFCAVHLFKVVARGGLEVKRDRALIGVNFTNHA